MNTLNLLTTSTNYISVGVDGINSVSLNWIGKLISWLFDLFGNMYGAVALGVICFTLILKTIVLPLDIYSRVKSKKQALLMEKMRPQMEKLQKQYANDKTMYSQKYMELQKQNGYSPFGACLPMIISLVIFMVVFSAFSTYSNYANLSTYNSLVNAYNTSVSVYVMVDETDADDSHFLLAINETNGSHYASADDYYKAVDNGDRIVYQIDFAKFDRYYTATNGSSAFGTATTEDDRIEVVLNYVKLNARSEAAATYHKNKPANSFGWIGSMWYPDSMLNKEVPSFSDFKSAISRAASGISSIYEESYNEVTYNLSKEKSTYNGYFVLIVLAIGCMFLQQFVMMRSQKATNEFSSVDGSGARTNKWMMIIMPIIFGIFSFFYSAAFSIYMIMNTLYSLVSTLIINKVVAVRYAKKAEQEATSTRGRKRLK